MDKMDKRSTAIFVASRASMFACALGVSFSLLGVPAASAITWNFSSPPGLLGNTQTYTDSGFTVTAAGFTNPGFSTPTALFGKAAGGDENGLGLNNDPTGDHEISGSNLIRIAMPAGVTNVQFTMGSTTSGEHWEVFGSNTSATSGFTSLLNGFDELTHSLPLEMWYYFALFGTGNPTGANVLLSSMTASAVPLPAAALLFGSALAGLGLLARRRKKQYPL